MLFLLPWILVLSVISLVILCVLTMIHQKEKNKNQNGFYLQKITTLCMYSNITALMQYFNTALCATSVMRHGSQLSYQSGYHPHPRLGTWQNLCSLCWLPCSSVGKTQTISRKKKKIFTGRECDFNFLIGREKLFPVQQIMNLERKQTHKQLNVLSNCLLSEFSVCNESVTYY